MYKKVGGWKIPLPDVPIQWNPPGWGSASVDPSIWPQAKLAMLVGIKPGGHIPFHRDNPARENGLDGTKLTRLHLVIASNPHCWNFHDGTWQQLEENSIYEMDPFLEHASINLGDSIRYHLVVDVE